MRTTRFCNVTHCHDIARFRNSLPRHFPLFLGRHFFLLKYGFLELITATFINYLQDVITFIKYAQNRKIGKQNNLIFWGEIEHYFPCRDLFREKCHPFFNDGYICTSEIITKLCVTLLDFLSL